MTALPTLPKSKVFMYILKSCIIWNSELLFGLYALDIIDYLLIDIDTIVL
jgi:hypothetical protein